MRIIAVATVAILAAGTAAAATTDRLVFGDSLSDPFVPGLVTPASQFTNGDTWAAQLGATSPERGNFAQAGATALSDGDETTDQDLEGQAYAFASSGLSLGPDPVAYVWFGGNDAAAAVQEAAPLAATGADPEVISQALSDRIGPAVTDLGDGLVRLIGAGVNDIVVFTAPDIGLTPLLSELGLSALGSQASAMFNEGLRNTVQGLSGTADIGLLDSAGVVAPALSDPAAYGLTNLTEPCIRDPRLESGEDCEGYAFFDPFHPTEAVHDLFADAAKAAADGDGDGGSPSPVPLPATAPLLLLALGGFGALRRRAA